MASTFTDNLELEKQAAGDNAGTWGDPILNANVIARVDAASGKTTAISLASSNVTLTQTQWRSKAFALTGVLSANINLILPLSVNDGGALTLAVGGEFVVDNQTTGAFTITVKTAATASTGVDVPQGVRSVLYSNTTNVVFADDQARSTMLTNAGDPNGTVTGIAGSLNTPASFRFDRTNGVIYACTTAGTVWGGVAASTALPQGYLTTNSSADNVIITADAIGVSTLYYTPYVGCFIPISNGSYFTLSPFAQLTLALSASQAANGIYDVYVFNDAGTIRVGTGPSWSAGASGSVTPGSCARGTGAGGAVIQRFHGLWVNTVAMTMTNGASTYSVAAGRGTCVGTIAIDSTQGQVTCHRTIGLSRKFNVANLYNRNTISLGVQDPTASWTYNVNTWRPSNNSTSNKMTALACVAEEQPAFNAGQMTIESTNGSVSNVGIGWNSTTSPSGAQFGCGGDNLGRTESIGAAYTAPPFLGLMDITCLEKSTALGGNSATFIGSTSMLMQGFWRG